MVGAARWLHDTPELSRRSFLAMLGWGAFVFAGLVAAFLNAAPSAFKAGPPSEYAVGSTTVLTDKRVPT
jgi:hypothetical protein